MTIYTPLIPKFHSSISYKMLKNYVYFTFVKKAIKQLTYPPWLLKHGHEPYNVENPIPKRIRMPNLSEYRLFHVPSYQVMSCWKIMKHSNYFATIFQRGEFFTFLANPQLWTSERVTAISVSSFHKLLVLSAPHSISLP